jgi:DNA-binding GntR family transcriptional regulator
MNMTHLVPAVHGRLSEHVLGQLREAILTGLFKPGERLREVDLASTLKVSRGPIREALAELEREGLVRVETYHGATVIQLTREDVEEIYSLRLALEILATQRVVQQAQPEELEAFAPIIDNLAEALERQDIRAIADYDVQFHDLLFRAAHHNRLYKAWSSLCSQLAVFMLVRNARVPPQRELLIDEHIAIVAALRARDEEAAVQLMKEHLRGSYERLLATYSSTENL